MPLTDTTTVRRIGGLNEADAFNLFRLVNDADLNSLISDTISDASSWLSLRAPVDYFSVVPAVQAMFKRAEACLTLHFIFLPLKARKTLGTQWPLSQEESQRFEELIQIDWYEQMRSLVEPYLIVDTPEKPFAAPAMALGKVIDYNSSTGGVILEQQKLDKIIDEATGISQPQFPLTRVGGGI